MLKIKLAILILILAGAGWVVYDHHQNDIKAKAQQVTTAAKNEAEQKAAQKVAELASRCSGNTAAQEVVVSISSQHMWACDGTKTVYDNAVITGMEKYPNDLTPPGTYKIYAKATDQTLRGSDQFGAWDDPVSYWMPFLSNNYGVYGFHDATWRSNSDFGKIDVNAPFTTTAKSGSHGCVEMPLAAAKWLYDWAPVGTIVSIQS